MQYNDVVISKSRLLSCFDDRSNDFFRVSQIEPEEGDSAMPLSFCNFTFILNFTSFVYNNCCTSAVQTSLTALGLQIISEKYLSDALKKCANCLAVWKIRVNTHTQSPRASIYRLFLKYQYFTESSFLRVSLLSALLSEPLHAALTNRGCASSYPSAVFAGAWSNYARKHRRYAFLLTRNNKPYQI